MSENLVRATQALQESIIDVLKSERRDKFAEAERLCRVGHSLLKAVGTRVVDLDVKCCSEDAEYTMGVGNHAYNPEYVLDPDTMQVRREKTLSTSIAAQAVTDSNRAAAKASEAAELRDLMGVVKQLPEGENRDAVQARVNVLLGSISRRVAPPEPAKEAPGLEAPRQTPTTVAHILAVAQQAAGGE